MCGIAGRFDREPADSRSRRQLRRMCDALQPSWPGRLRRVRRGRHRPGHPAAQRDRRRTRPPADHAPRMAGSRSSSTARSTTIASFARARSRGHRFHTDSDTESLLHAFAAYGPDCLSRLNGMFAVAIWDSRDAAALSGPRSGRRQAALPLRRRPIDLVRLGDQGAPRRNPGPAGSRSRGVRLLPALWLRRRAGDTASRHVRKLPAAHYMTVPSATAVVTRQYWTLSYRPDAGSEEELTEQGLQACSQQSVQPGARERCAAWRVSEWRPRLELDRAADERSDRPAGEHVLHRLPGRRRLLQRAAGRGAHLRALRDHPS